MEQSQKRQSLFSRVKQYLKPKFKPPANVIEVLLSIVDPRSPWLLGAFLCGFFLLSNWGNFFYSWIQEGSPLPPPMWQRLLESSAVLVGVGIALYLFDLWRRKRKLMTLAKVTEVLESTQEGKRYPGLITLYNPRNEGTTQKVILRHCPAQKTTEEETAEKETAEKETAEEEMIEEEPTLKYCWCLMERNEKVKKKFEKFVEKRMSNSGVEFLPYYISNVENVRQSYAAVDNIYRYKIEAKEYQYRGEKKQLQPVDVVTNITPGLRTMAIGMALACLMYDRKLEYMRSDYDEDNKPKPDTQKFIELDLKFYLE